MRDRSDMEKAGFYDLIGKLRSTEDMRSQACAIRAITGPGCDRGADRQARAVIAGQN